MTAQTDPLLARAQALKIHGLLAHWEAVATCPWLPPLIQWEAEEIHPTLATATPRQCPPWPLQALGRL